MYRKEQLITFAKQFMQQRMECNIKHFKNAIKQDERKINKNLLDCMDALFKTCIIQQQKGGKQSIRYIHFFYLRLSLLLHQYEIQINMFSEQSYMDAIETMELWNPAFIVDIFERDIKMMEIEMKRQMGYIGYPQLVELRERCFTIYIMIIGQYLKSMVGDIIKLPSFHQIKKAEGIQFVFGGYMDRGIQIWPV